MSDHPFSDAAPLVGGAGVRTESSSAIIVVDVAHVYALNGLMFYESANRMARNLGPEIFPPGSVRSIAIALLTGQTWTLPTADPKYIAEAAALVDAMSRCDLPHTPAWADNLVRLLADRRWRPLLDDQLQWACERVRAGDAPLWYVRRAVNRAFDVAEGNLPLDPADSLEREVAA